MPTLSTNFPPERTMEIGEFNASSLSGATGSFPSTTIFTAPTTGIYEFGLLVHFLASDGAGTLTITIMPPHVLPNSTAANVPGVDSDFSFTSRGTWMNAGDSFQLSGTAAGFGATTYNLFFAVFRIF